MPTIRRLAGKVLGQKGQATSESAVLLLTTLLIGGGTAGYLLSQHSAWLNGLNIYIHGFYYLLSLPFP